MQKRKPMHKFCPYYTPQLQIEGYLKFKKKYKNTPQLQVEGYLKFSKKNRKIPRKSKLRGIIRTKFRHFLGYPATPSGGVPESQKK